MAMMVEREKTDLQLKPGAADLLPALKKAGYRLAVASSSPRDMVLTNLGRTGIDSYFDVVVCGDEVSRGKPDPDIFLLAAERLGLLPGDCYVLEDSPNGIRAGHRAGCSVLMVPNMVQPDEEIRELCTGIYGTLSDVKKAMASGAL
jgi:HAD superfamily hydrolase (TIGR01509 family)